MNDLHELFNTLDGRGLATLVRNGEVSPGELLETAIARVEQVEPGLNAVSERLYEQARSQASGSSVRQGVMAGVPTLVKDMFTPMTGARMTSGSHALGEFRSNIDCEIVSRLRQAGCQLIGTTTAPEFGVSYSTESQRFGATCNPWNLQHSAGGSSGGAAALVAARAIPFAHGNDGGGSLRVPASCCGVFGFKPSRGLLPSGPMVGEGWAGLSTAHAITLSVGDSAALLDATAGSDLGAPYAAPMPATPFAHAAGRDPRRLKIALISAISPWPAEPEALAALQNTAALLEALGHYVVPATLPVQLPEFLDATFDIIGSHTQGYLDLLGKMRGFPVAMDEVEPRTRVILRERGQLPATRYISAVESMHALGRAMAGFFEEYDIVLTPTLNRAPPRLGELAFDDDSRSLQDFIALSHRYSPYTAIFNATGQPAMSVPLYWTADSLPLGSHFAARFGDELTLLSLAGQLERAQPWAARRPPLNACAG
ncbi:amidase [Pseudomonas syringae]|uniref:amidase n=1 Tax=Pseudomonas syringae TaxID=317 RepID=UPI000CDAB01F|nr:amidase [Pseudomonas syringae]POR64403.1 amidase [Pseudomonas syringae pv. syringae]